MLRLLNEPKIHFNLSGHQRIGAKQSFCRIQLRSSKGELLGPTDAADTLRDWYQELYSANDVHSEVQQFVWPFSSDEFPKAFNCCHRLRPLLLNLHLLPFGKLQLHILRHTYNHMWSTAVPLNDYQHAGVKAH